MAKQPAVVVVAPNAFYRFLDVAFENQFQLITKTGHLASFHNLDALINQRSQKLDNGYKDVNPMAGYYLESFLKQRGYDVQVVFDWTTDDDLLKAMKSDPIAIMFSTTYVTDCGLLGDCLQALRTVAPDVPLIVGGPYIYKQRNEFWRDDKQEMTAIFQGLPRIEAFRKFDIDLLAGCLFGDHTVQRLRDVIYVASEFGEYTVLKVLDAIQKGRYSFEDLAQIPNLVLSQKGGKWHATPEEPEPINLNTDFTRWDLVDAMPSIVPLRTSVGCPFKCRYCDFIEIHPRVIMRNPESIVEEIRLAQNRGRHIFNFIDDNIFLNKTRINQLSNFFIQSDLSVVWGGFFRVDRIDETNIENLYKSGCRYGLCGIESGDPGQLERMNKECKTFEIARGIDLATSAGMRLVLTFIVGFPGETQQSLDNTAALINGLSTSHSGYASFQVYPLLLLPESNMDHLEFRAQFALKGRYQTWEHLTMNFREATDIWSPYLFRQVHSLPYEYYTADSLKGWNYIQRNQGYLLRRELSLAFLDGQPDHVVQDCFNRLYRFLKPSSDPVAACPPWTTFMADRPMQPGNRKPRDRMAG